MRSVRVLLGIVLLVTVTLAGNAAEAEVKRILVFGDSNSWGWIPVEKGSPSGRYPKEKQWPFVMQAKLGSDYEVVVDALSGRTTDVADPTFPQLTGAGLDGSAALPSVIAAHLPLDLVIIMLGTNDTKQHFNRSAFRIALGAGKLVDIVQSSGNMFGGGWYTYPAPKVLLVAPPPVGPQKIFGEVFAGAEERSKGMAAAYKAVAEAAGVPFYDAGSATSTDGVDGIHFTEAGQRKLGDGIAEAARAALK